MRYLFCRFPSTSFSQLRNFSSTATPYSRKAKVENAHNIIWSYKDQVKIFFDELEIAVAPMKLVNDPFVISRKENEFKIDSGPKGLFIITSNPQDESISMRIPHSGVFSYKYCLETKQWLGVADNHDFRGMFIRDLIRDHCGVPNFTI